MTADDSSTSDKNLVKFRPEPLSFADELRRMGYTLGFATHSTLCLKNDTVLACYNFDQRQPVSIIFGRNVAKKVSSQMVLYFATSHN